MDKRLELFHEVFEEEGIEKSSTNETDLLYVAIRVLTTDKEFADKVYGTLKKNGIHTIEQTKNLSDEKMKNLHNCSPKTMELLKRFRIMAGGNSNG